jgi:hypothetical protein
LDRLAGFSLDHRGAVLNSAAADAHVAHPKPHEIAAPQLAIDRQIEQGEIASAPLKSQPDADRPDLLWFEWTFLAGETACSRELWRSQ